MQCPCLEPGYDETGLRPNVIRAGCTSAVLPGHTHSVAFTSDYPKMVVNVLHVLPVLYWASWLLAAEIIIMSFVLFNVFCYV